MTFDKWLAAKLGGEPMETKGHDAGKLITEFLQEKHGLVDEDFSYDGETLALARGVPDRVVREAQTVCRMSAVKFDPARF